MDESENRGEPVDPALVGEAAVAFMDGLSKAFGAEATVEAAAGGSVTICVDSADTCEAGQCG